MHLCLTFFFSIFLEVWWASGNWSFVFTICFKWLFTFQILLGFFLQYWPVFYLCAGTNHFGYSLLTHLQVHGTFFVIDCLYVMCSMIWIPYIWFLKIFSSSMVMFYSFISLLRSFCLSTFFLSPSLNILNVVVTAILKSLVVVSVISNSEPTVFISLVIIFMLFLPYPILYEHCVLHKQKLPDFKVTFHSIFLG